MKQAPDSSTTGTQYAVRAVLRTLDIFEALQSSPDGVSLPALSEAVGLPKSSIFRYLSTLEARGYIERDRGSGHYRVGRALHPSTSEHLEALAARARPLLEGLRDRFGETTNLGVLDGRRVAYLEIVESPRAMRFAARKGDRDPIHSTALGKAIASRLLDRQVQRILADEGMPQLTSRTITDPGRFLKELAVVRDRGYATDNGENEEEGRCVAVPIPDGRLAAAISLSAPAARFSLSAIKKVAVALREVAVELPRDLGGVGA
jgi:IclR family acetate operon transcriptional repressor